MHKWVSKISMRIIELNITRKSIGIIEKIVQPLKMCIYAGAFSDIN